jgi:hypothetical protein
VRASDRKGGELARIGKVNKLLYRRTSLDVMKLFAPSEMEDREILRRLDDDQHRAGASDMRRGELAPLGMV